MSVDCYSITAFTLIVQVVVFLLFVTLIALATVLLAIITMFVTLCYSALLVRNRSCGNLPTKGLFWDMASGILSLSQCHMLMEHHPKTM